MKHSTRWRSLYNSLSISRFTLRLLRDGITASALWSRINSTIASESYDPSAKTASKSKDSSSCEAIGASWAWPPVKMKRIGSPRASTVTWIFEENPPRLRPKAWASCPPFFWVLQPLPDEHGWLLNQATTIPYLGHWWNVGAFWSKHLCHPICKIVCSSCSIYQIPMVNHVMGHRSLPSNGPPLQIGDTFLHSQCKYSGILSKIDTSWPNQGLLFLVLTFSNFLIVNPKVNTP